MSTQTVSTSGSGLVFNNTYTASCSQQFINCIVAAEKAYESLWSNTLTVNITFNEQASGIDGTLASNTWSSWVPVTYTQLRSALPASDALPGTDPTGGHTWYLPEAYARMLGLSSYAPATDDTVTLNSSYDWSFGQDVTATIEHEISEGVMGRVGGLGDQNGVWSTMDLFRYSSPGVRDFTDGRDGLTTYFSVNGSALSSLSFNNEFLSNGTKANSNDVADFTQNDVYGTGYPGETDTLSQTDITIMDALGWRPRTTHVAPTVTGHAFSVATNQSVTLSADITTTNPSSDDITTYWVEDLGGGNGHLAVGGVTETDGHWIQVSSLWSNVQYVGGSSAGTDTLEVAMYDATTGNYVYSAGFAATTKPPHVAPTATGHAFSVATNQSVALSADITTANPSSDSITTYWVDDLGGGSGHLAVGGVTETDGHWIQVSSLWSNVQYVGGSSAGTDTLEVAMYDATTGNYVYSAGFAATTQATSPNDTVISVVNGTSTGAITDAHGIKWAVAHGEVTVNGVIDQTTANVIELAYVNGEVWQENSADLWWGKTTPANQWSPTDGTYASPLPHTTSPNDTALQVTGGTSSGVITDANGIKWAVAHGQVTVNGVIDSTTANVIELAYVNGKVWQENSADLWWGKAVPGDQWSPTYGTTTSPLPKAVSAIEPVGIGSGAVVSPVTDVVSGDNISKNIAVGDSTPVFISGNADSLILPAAATSLAITDNGQGTTIALSNAPAAGATITIFDFQNDAGGVISIADQYHTAKAALTALRSDGQGGSILPFANGSSLHFVGDNDLTTANFRAAVVS